MSSEALSEDTVQITLQLNEPGEANVLLLALTAFHVGLIPMRKSIIPTSLYPGYVAVAEMVLNQLTATRCLLDLLPCSSRCPHRATHSLCLGLSSFTRVSTTFASAGFLSEIAARLLRVEWFSR